VIVRGLPPGTCSVRRLHEDSFDVACLDPQRYRAGRVVGTIERSSSIHTRSSAWMWAHDGRWQRGYDLDASAA